MTFTEAASSPPAGRSVAITFDDAYRSVLELARPILDSFAAPATVFVPTDYIGDEEPLCWPGIDRWHGGADERELTPMSWAQLRDARQAAAGRSARTPASHPHLTQLDDSGAAQMSSPAPRPRAKRTLGASCTSLAYPYGDVDARVVAATARAGYRAARSAARRALTRAILCAGRASASIALTTTLRFRLKVSPALLCLRRSRAWERLARARR